MKNCNYSGKARNMLLNYLNFISGHKNHLKSESTNLRAIWLPQRIIDKSPQ